MDIKDLIRKSLNFLHLDLTKNLEYDRLTKVILKMVIHENSNCIDVGCHKGEILEQLIKYAPKGHHYAFEPLPDFYNQLKNNFKSHVTIYPYALSDEGGNSTFQYVKNAPAYSGIKKRSYDIDNPEIEEISVEVKTLDELISTDVNIELIKIDVEGGELGVLKGARRILKNSKPFVVFECGLGASEYYGTTPKDIFNIFDESDLRVSTLKSFIKNSGSMDSQTFSEVFQKKEEYYFIAHP